MSKGKLTKDNTPYVVMRGKGREITRDKDGKKVEGDVEKDRVLFFASPDSYIIRNKILYNGWQVVGYGGFNLPEARGENWEIFKADVKSRLVKVEDERVSGKSKARSSARD